MVQLGGPAAHSGNTGYYIGHDDNMTNWFAQRTLENSAAYLMSSLTPSMNVLDVGCGPGSITLDFARHVPAGHVTGVDTPAALSTLQKARRDAVAQGVANVEFVVGDVLALPFADDTFDLTHAHQVLQHVTDPVQALREMRRVTRTGGIVACREAEMHSMILYPPSQEITVLTNVFSRLIEETSPRDPRVGRKLHKWARDAGFDSARMRTSSSTWTFRTPEERMWFAEPMSKFTTEADFARAAVEKGYTTEEELKHMSQAWLKWAEEEDGLMIMVNIEMVCRM